MAEQARVVTAAAAESMIAVRDRAAAHAQQVIAGLWSKVNPYDERAVSEFAAQAARVMGSAQAAAVRAASAAQVRQLAAVGVKASGARSVPVDVRGKSATVTAGKVVVHRPTVAVDYQGADTAAKVTADDMSTAGIFQRPAALYRYARSQDAPEAEASRQAVIRIRTLVDDNLMLAQRLAQQQVLAAAVDLDAATQATIIGYRRVIHPELSRGGTCGMCIAASDRLYKIGTLMPIHAHCVPGDSLIGMPAPVSGVGGMFRSALEAATRREFKGELVEFVTASGNQVRVTPNHPVLTDKGWFPAHLIGVGDTVFRRSRRERPVLSGPEIDDRPALAQNVFRTRRMVGGVFVRMPVAAEDFHGDWTEGEVDVVWTDSHFTAIVDREQFGELCFVHAGLAGAALDGGSLSAPLIPGRLASAAGIVGGGGYGGALLGSGLGVSELGRTSAAANLNAPAEQFTVDNRAAYAERGRDLLNRLAGQVEADCVVECRRVGFSGHVYDFQTADGWFEANNCIVSNCKCTIAAVTDEYDPADDLNAVDLRALYKDAGGNTVAHLKRTRYQVDEHGELGPVLVPQKKYKPRGKRKSAAA